MRIYLEQTAGEQIPGTLEAAAANAKNPAMSAKAAAAWMVGETFGIFSEAMNVNGVWEPLSKVTMFLRAHRANAPRRGGQPGSDTGRLKGSFFADYDADGTQFGAGTNLDYAEDFDKGGLSKPNDVAIKGFTRKSPGGSIGLAGGKVAFSGGGVKVKDYVMHMKGGNRVPARQFWPHGMDELATWGYLDKIREIFALDFKSILGGTA